MKPLELTNEHKDKLLEMTEKLFPEYNNIYFRIDSKLSNINTAGQDSNILRLGNLKTNLDISIHWFEFCIIWIPEKIVRHPKFNNEFIIGMPQYYDGSEVIDYIMESCVNLVKDINPIDYLYEEFLKLK